MSINFLSSTPSVVIWSPPPELLFTLLVIGALMVAAVVLMIFSFYEDFYWGDADYRNELRWNSNRKKGRV